MVVQCNSGLGGMLNGNTKSIKERKLVNYIKVTNSFDSRKALFLEAKKRALFNQLLEAVVYTILLSVLCMLSSVSFVGGAFIVVTYILSYCKGRVDLAGCTSYSQLKESRGIYITIMYHGFALFLPVIFYYDVFYPNLTIYIVTSGLLISVAEAILGDKFS